MLDVRDLHTHYGLSHVLQGVTLAIGRGEVFGVFGRNGVGKTTLVKAVAGWVPATSGAIVLDGVALAGLAPERVCRAGVALVPEDRRIFPGLTVEENLRLGLMQTTGHGRAEGERRIERTYARFPRLFERRRQLGTTLSGGEQQMLAIARVLVGAPKLVLIDEPTEGLAPQIVDEIFALLDELRREGIAVLLVEQNVTRAIEVCDRFCALERGTVVLSGAGGSAADRARLFEAIAV